MWVPYPFCGPPAPQSRSEPVSIKGRLVEPEGKRIIDRHIGIDSIDRCNDRGGFPIAGGPTAATVAAFGLKPWILAKPPRITSLSSTDFLYKKRRVEEFGTAGDRRLRTAVNPC